MIWVRIDSRIYGCESTLLDFYITKTMSKGMWNAMRQFYEQIQVIYLCLQIHLIYVFNDIYNQIQDNVQCCVKCDVYALFLGKKTLELLVLMVAKSSSMRPSTSMQ